MPVAGNGAQGSLAMRVSEIFYSLQGEGLLTGVPGVFIRLAGCPLRCKWCDTEYAWEATAAQDYPIQKIVDRVGEVGCPYIVVTGGEPMTQPELSLLLDMLKGPGRHITVETAGIAFLPDLACDFMSISPKTGNSLPDEPGRRKVHERARLNIDALRKLIARYDYQLKFVVDSPDDLAEIQQLVDQIGGVDRKKVFLMPQAATRDELIARSPMVAELAKGSGLCFSTRLHILLWNNQRAT